MWPEVPPFHTKTIRLLEGDLFTFTVDATGMYVDGPNLYCLMALRPTSMSFRAMENRMNAVCQSHNWAAEMGIDIKQRIQSLTFFGKDEIAGLRQELRVNLLTRSKSQKRGGRRKPKRNTVTNGQWRSRCTAVRDYIVWHSEVVIQRMSPRDERLAEARERLKDFREWMTEKITVRKGDPREGPSEYAAEVFLRAITPGHPSNPFAVRHQHRNHALWLTYFDGGIRRSEALGLKGEDLRLRGEDPELFVHRRPDDPDEVRSTAPNTKTRPHPVSLSSIVIALRWIKTKNVAPVSRRSTQGFYRLADIESAILGMQPKLPPGSPPLSKYLFLIPRWFGSDRESMWPVVTFVTDGRFSDFLSGRLPGRSVFDA